MGRAQASGWGTWCLQAVGCREGALRWGAADELNPWPQAPGPAQGRRLPGHRLVTGGRAPAKVQQHVLMEPLFRYPERPSPCWGCSCVRRVGRMQGGRRAAVCLRRERAEADLRPRWPPCSTGHRRYRLMSAAAGRCSAKHPGCKQVPRSCTCGSPSREGSVGARPAVLRCSAPSCPQSEPRQGAQLRGAAEARVLTEGAAARCGAAEGCNVERNGGGAGRFARALSSRTDRRRCRQRAGGPQRRHVRQCASLCTTPSSIHPLAAPYPTAHCILSSPLQSPDLA